MRRCGDSAFAATTRGTPAPRIRGMPGIDRLHWPSGDFAEYCQERSTMSSFTELRWSAGGSGRDEPPKGTLARLRPLNKNQHFSLSRDITGTPVANPPGKDPRHPPHPLGPHDDAD